MANSIMMCPSKFGWLHFFILASAVVDYVDGLLARLLKASSAMGRELDSLSDVVSFGVAPSLILYQFLRLSWAQGEQAWINQLYYCGLPFYCRQQRLGV